jgi:hypothetical protein
MNFFNSYKLFKKLCFRGSFDDFIFKKNLSRAATDTQDPQISEHCPTKIPGC